MQTSRAVVSEFESGIFGSLSKMFGTMEPLGSCAGFQSVAVRTLWQALGGVGESSGRSWRAMFFLGLQLSSIAIDSLSSPPVYGSAAEPFFRQRTVGRPATGSWRAAVGGRGPSRWKHSSSTVIHHFPRDRGIKKPWPKDQGKWSWTDLNRRPSACKADALPTELQPQVDKNPRNQSNPQVEIGRSHL